MKKELKRLLALGLVSILMFIGCPNDSSGKGPPVCENEDCKCQDCDGEDCDCNEEQGPQPERGSHGNDTPIPFSHGEVVIKGENLYPSEWQGLVEDIIAILNIDGWNGYFADLINIHGPVTIIVKSTNEFLNYKTTKSGDTIYININTNNLEEALQDAFTAIDGHAPEMAQAIPQGHAKLAANLIS